MQRRPGSLLMHRQRFGIITSGRRRQRRRGGHIIIAVRGRRRSFINTIITVRGKRGFFLNFARRRGSYVDEIFVRR